MKKTYSLSFTILISIQIVLFSCNSNDKIEVENKKREINDSLINVEEKQYQDTVEYLFNKYKDNIDTTIFKHNQIDFSDIKFYTYDYQKLLNKIIVLRDIDVIDIYKENDSVFVLIKDFSILKLNRVVFKLMISENDIQSFRKNVYLFHDKTPIVIKIISVNCSQYEDSKDIKIAGEIIEFIPNLIKHYRIPPPADQR